jgi:hypothetical protein
MNLKNLPGADFEAQGKSVHMGLATESETDSEDDDSEQLLQSPKPGQSKESLEAQLAAVRDLDPGSVPADMRQKSIDTLHDAEFRLTAALAVASHIDLNVGKRAMAALHSVYMSLSEVDSSYTVLADKLAETFEAQFDSKYTSNHSWINQALECLF